MNPESFSTLKLHPDLLSAVSALGYQQMTAIQAASLPDILAGSDVIAQAKTGSGKTAAFGLGLLQRIADKLQGDPSADQAVQSMVLCPTRELADQVAREIRKLARDMGNIKILSLCGGMPFAPQASSLQHGAQIIVGTPGRIEDHLDKATLTLDQLNTVVLDEADRMLEMGFQATLDAIMAHVPAQRQTLLFSATFPDQIKRISRRMMQQPITVKVASAHDNTIITQHFYPVKQAGQRLDAVRLLLLQYRPESALIFCNTKRETTDVTQALLQHGFSAATLNGDLEQWQRDQTMIRFANHSIAILVATDVAARGLDIDALDLVINYNLAHDPETHLHRIGRTGRAGHQGTALTLFDDDDGLNMVRLADSSDTSITPDPLPPIKLLQQPPITAPMATLQIGGGKKQKLRPGDILGALTGEHGISGKQVGKIHILDQWAYVAVERSALKSAQRKLGAGKLKGRSFRIRLI